MRIKRIEYIYRHLICTVILISGVAFMNSVSGQSFSHPGILQSKASIERMSIGVQKKISPIYEDYLLLKNHPESQPDYQMKGPMQMVGRNPTVGQGAYDSDANAAFQNALMWVITGQHAYAEKAIQIVDAWSSTLDTITGRDAVLMAGLGPFKMVNAAELLRYSHTGWKVASIRKAEHHFKAVIYPVIKDFAPFANGNWDAAAEKTMLAIGVFCNDREIFDRAINYYVSGWGDGSIFHYINRWGQCQESGRDQGHTQLGLAHLADCSEIAWNQGLDLYSYGDNRLLKGFEYTAKYNLGRAVKYVPELDRTGKYLHPLISEKGRGALRAIYGEVYSHYHGRMGLATPFTAAASKKISPEPQGLPGADHTGFGNLFYGLLPVESKSTGSGSGSFRSGQNAHPDLSWTDTAPATTSGLTLEAAKDIVVLQWVKVRGAKGYLIQRSTTPNGAFKELGRVQGTSRFTDQKVKAGVLYYYQISAFNDKGPGAFCKAKAVSAGAAKGWQDTTFEKSAESVSRPAPGSNAVQFDGQTYRIETRGRGITPAPDSLGSYHYYYHSLQGDGSLSFCYQPQISAQMSSFGIMIRSSLKDKDGFAGCFLLPKATGAIEEPDWRVVMLLTPNEGLENAVASSITTTGRISPVVGSLKKLNKDPGVVTYGRLTGPIWLKLKRKGSQLSCFSSKDGQHWERIGQSVVRLPKNTYIGIYTASGYDKLGSTVQLDHLALEEN